MAKKDKEEKKSEQKDKQITSKSSFTKFCAFWGITIAATLFLVGGTFQILDKLGVNFDGIQTCINVFELVAKIALLIAVGIPAYGYVKNKKLGWRIVFIVAIVFYAGFCVFRIF